ncbi:MAG: hypothetical protein M3P47_06910 [Pseudomonadota bacterium]|nr:hypothetical protein [Pseudomonadota bacterium]
MMPCWKLSKKVSPCEFGTSAGHLLVANVSCSLSLKDGKVRARCIPSGETKIFVVEKMELAVEGVPSELAGAFPAPLSVYPSVDEFINHQFAYLQKLGWVVQREGDVVSLHRTFKNGKLIKTPDVSLQFEAITYDLVFDGENVIETNHRERSRPWVVSATKQTTKTLGDFGKAQLAFLEFAKSLAPSGVTPDT